VEQFEIFSYSVMQIRQIKSKRRCWRGMWHAWDGTEKRKMFWWESPKERDHSEDRGVDGSVREIGCGGVEWIQLAQDRNRWRDLVNSVMNLRVLEPRS
jgi:hypothetical protein